MSDLYEELVEAESIEDFPEEDRSYRKLTELWHKEVNEKLSAMDLNGKPKTNSRLDYLPVFCDGVEYRVYGVIHGWTGAGSDDYRKMIHRSLKGEEAIIYEKMLGRIYSGRNVVEMPDFCVLRWWGQMMLSFRFLLIWPVFIIVALKDILTEILRRHEKTEQGHIDDITYHTLDPELRRGLDGSLPTRLQVEYEMRYWCRLRALFDSYLLFCVVPRSAYMAEFARNWVKCNSHKKIAIVVGDRHLTEVKYFLEKPVNSAWIARTAQSHAFGIYRSHWYYKILFFRYFFFLLLGGFLGVAPWLAGYVAYLFFYS